LYNYSELNIEQLKKAICICLCFYTVFLFFSIDIVSQETNEVAMWRGYKHSWTYNHRINRIGSFVDNEKKEITYTSASGFGADSTFYTAGYSLLKSNKFHCEYGKVVLELEGKEKELIVATQEIELPYTGQEIKENKFYTVLNGYDVLSMRKADKLNYLQIKIDEVSYTENTVKFNISASIIANCHSLECELLEKKMHYKIDVYYLLMRGEQEHINAQNFSYSKDYTWDKKNELVNNPDTMQLQLMANEYQNVAVGIKSFSANFDDDHWFLEWNNYVETVGYIGETGMVHLLVDFYYKCWSEGMKKKTEFTKHNQFSMKSKGQANLNLSLAVFQFNDTEIEQQNESGRMFWVGRNASSNSPDAMDRIQFRK